MKENIVIVIADDDDGHAILIKRNLNRNGVTNPVIYFKNGEELLQFFEQKKLSTNLTNERYFILLDIKMPKVDGLEVLEKMKGNQLTSMIPIVMITTTDNPKEIEACQKLGCNSYIIKPIDCSKLIEIAKSLNHQLNISTPISNKCL